MEARIKKPLCSEPAQLLCANATSRRTIPNSPGVILRPARARTASTGGPAFAKHQPARRNLRSMTLGTCTQDEKRGFKADGAVKKLIWLGGGTSAGRSPR